MLFKILGRKNPRVELSYDVMKGTEYFVSLKTSDFITEENNAMVNSEELTGTTQYLTLTRCRRIRCPYKDMHIYVCACACVCVCVCVCMCLSLRNY
jgi:hypothetical protein